MSDTNGDSVLPRVDEEDPIEMDNQGASYEGNTKPNGVENNLSGMSSPGTGDTTLSDIIAAPPAPTLSMVTKHLNGSLNLWQLTFADKSKFSQVGVWLGCKIRTIEGAISSWKLKRDNIPKRNIHFLSKNIDIFPYSMLIVNLSP